MVIGRHHSRLLILKPAIYLPFNKLLVKKHTYQHLIYIYMHYQCIRLLFLAVLTLITTYNYGLLMPF